MKKSLLMCAAMLLFVGFAVAQTEEPVEETPETPATELPAEAAHGKTVSELAKTTESGPEKGKIISSAARERSMKGKAEGVSRRENRRMQRAGQSVMPEVPARPEVTPPTTGRPATTPPVTPPAGGRPSGIPGGN
jgi:hypothetical protein